jgi:PQQ-dependent dehydrogenase (methanol/ethanol family)
MRLQSWLTVALVSMGASFAQGPGAQPPAPAALQGTAPNIAPVTDAMLANPNPNDWLMWRRTHSNWGFSPLTQITKANVKGLQLVWTRALGAGVQEGTPLVHDGVMFFPNPGDYIQAFNAGTGELFWEYRRKWPQDLGRFIPFPTINRNLAIYGDQIIDTSADDFVFALNAKNGQLAWETRILDYREAPAQETAGPMIAQGKIFSTRGCEAKGSPDACVVTAHDAKTGKELWRTHLIPRKGEPGDDSWGDIPYEKRHHVGAWMVPSFDADLNMLYLGTSVTAPAPKFLIAGNDKKHLYHNSTLALDANTGKIVWHYQHLVDHWDLDHPFERLLVDTAVAPDAAQVAWINPKIRPGERRKVITGVPGKTGLVYTLDRQTGEFLWARPTVKQTVISKIDGATGEVTVNPASLFHKEGDSALICPTVNGGKGFQAGAYSPAANVMFYGLQNTCADYTAQGPDAPGAYAFTAKPVPLGPNDPQGTLFAISAETGKTLWKVDQRAGFMSSVATASGVLFTGDAGGQFRAFDQETGRILWSTNLGAPVTGYPVTYSAGGRQYVAVSTGNSPLSTSLNAQTRDIRLSNNSALYVFALPQ